MKGGQSVSLLLIQQQYWPLFIALDAKEDKTYNYLHIFISSTARIQYHG